MDKQQNTAISISEERLREMRELVRTAIDARRNAMVYCLAQHIAGLLQSSVLTAPPGESQGGSWIKVESLSQLRTLVGGRFRNLKDRWTSAGLPLREHRGDRKEKANLDLDGWTELAAWISRQGFDVRLASGEEPWLFELRRVRSVDPDLDGG